MTRVDPSSPVHQEVSRLYRIAQEQRPGGQDLWNGELYARSDDKWGGFSRDGSLRLNQDLVLRHLTGGSPSEDRAAQSQALSTVLHESRHARTSVDAAAEPNALRQAQSMGLDEGLTELSTVEDFADFADRAGYQGLPQPDPEYAGAVHAADALLDRATNSPDERAALLNRALDQPVVMRWDTIADSVVRNELGDIVPADPAHQQAARAHVVNQMAIPEWAGVQNRPNAGPLVAADTNAAISRAASQVEAHYQQNPGEPFPAKTPNPEIAPDAATRVDSPGHAAQTGEMRFLSGQAPAAQATRHAPSLGDGARGAGAPQVAGVGRRSPGERGRE